MIEDKTSSEKLLDEQRKAMIKKMNTDTKNKQKPKMDEVTNVAKKAWKALDKL